MLLLLKKTLLLSIILTGMFSSLYAQKNTQTPKTKKDLLQEMNYVLPKAKYSMFINEWSGSDSLIIKKIPALAVQKLFCEQGFPCICVGGVESNGHYDKKYNQYFEGLSAYQFKRKESKFFLYMIGVDNDAGCLEQEYVATIDMNGNLLDKIIFYGYDSLGMVEPRYNYIAGELHEDSVVVFQQYYLQNWNDRTKLYKLLYQLNQEGKFMLQERVEILDPKKYFPARYDKKHLEFFHIRFP